MKEKKVSIIIPAYNEEKNITSTLSHLNLKWVKEIIVVDDGSDDKTYDLAKNFNISLYRFSKNKGKGEAVTFAVKKAEGDIILLIDADLGNSVREAEKLVKPIINDEVQITIAEIPIRGGGIGLVRKVAELILYFLTKRKMKAPLSGQRAFRRNTINELMPFSVGFGLELGMDIDIIINNFTYKEILCNFQHDVTGQSITGYYHRFKQLCDILKTSVVKWYQLINVEIDYSKE